MFNFVNGSFVALTFRGQKISIVQVNTFVINRLRGRRCQSIVPAFQRVNVSWLPCCHFMMWKAYDTWISRRLSHSECWHSEVRRSSLIYWMGYNSRNLYAVSTSTKSGENAEGLTTPLPTMAPPSWALRRLGRIGTVVG